jgi:hypothetical protein
MSRVQLACLVIATTRLIIGIGLIVILDGGVDDGLGTMMIMTMIIEDLQFATWADWVLFQLVFGIGLEGVRSEAFQCLAMISRLGFDQKDSVQFNNL